MISTVFVAICVVGAIACQSGFAVEIPFINTTFYEGAVARALNGTDLSWLVGLAVTVPLYYFSAVRRGLTKPAPVADAHAE